MYTWCKQQLVLVKYLCLAHQLEILAPDRGISYLCPLMAKSRFSIIRPERFPVFYGYVIAIAGTLGVVASMPGQTVGVSVFTDPVKDALGLTRDQFSLAYMLGTIMSSFLLGRAGVWYDRYGAKIVSFWATIGLMFTLVLCSYSALLSTALQDATGYSHWALPFTIMILLFFLLRFSGQGVLTLVSRNMIMKWFDKRRGRINALSGIVRSFGFSTSPLVFSILIDDMGWQGAWQYIAVALAFFAVFVLLFFRDNPEDYGLIPDGKIITSGATFQTHDKRQPYTLAEARQTRAFWMYSLVLSFNAFFVTGITFHIVSVFELAGFGRDTAISIFLPMAIVAIITSFIFNALSDWVKLKYLLFAMIAGGYVVVFGLITLAQPWGIYLIVGGSGIMGGLFSVLMAITWPRFYGRKHLGAISGKTMSMLVFASAIGPYLFSVFNDYFGSYTGVGWLSIGLLLFITIGSLKADNPQ